MVPASLLLFLEMVSARCRRTVTASLRSVEVIDMVLQDNVVPASLSLLMEMVSAWYLHLAGPLEVIDRVL